MGGVSMSCRTMNRGSGTDAIRSHQSSRDTLRPSCRTALMTPVTAYPTTGGRSWKTLLISGSMNPSFLGWTLKPSMALQMLGQSISLSVLISSGLSVWYKRHPLSLWRMYGSIIESRYARNYIPKFQAKFGIPEGESGGPKLGPTTGQMSTPLPSKYPTPGALPMRGVAETREAPSNEGLLLALTSHFMFHNHACNVPMRSTRPQETQTLWTTF
jgi:hypothetical protein